MQKQASSSKIPQNWLLLSESNPLHIYQHFPSWNSFLHKSLTECVCFQNTGHLVCWSLQWNYLETSQWLTFKVTKFAHKFEESRLPCRCNECRNHAIMRFDLGQIISREDRNRKQLTYAILQDDRVINLRICFRFFHYNQI